MNKKYQLFTIVIIVATSFMSGIAQVPEKYQQNLLNYQEVTIDIQALKDKLQNVPFKGLASENRKSKTLVSLPIPTGGTQRFRVVESPILSPELSNQLPLFKSYAAQGIDDPTATARFNITPVGLYAVVKGINGISYIEKIDKSKQDDQYITYYDHQILSSNENGFCESEQIIDPGSLPEQNLLTNSCFQNGANLRTYQMVVTCTGEFYQLNGNSDPTAQAALLARVTQINAIYEPELAITFTIVEYLLNSDPGTDPFSDPTNTTTSISEAETYINANVTAPSWDLGHGFHEITCGGSCGWAGRAGVGVVCTTSKASGYTYLPNDIPTAVTVLLHEIGHMFSCYHTNYGCDTENNCERYEPGQGSSIMSTSAGCDGGDFFASRTDYFGIGSLQSFMNFTSTGTRPNNNASCTSSVAPGWSDCSAISATGNNMPSSDADANNIDGLQIPHSTPFTLSGTGSDPDGMGSLTYSWEQYDTDYAGSGAPDDTGASTTAPQFRSFPPSTSNERTCPQLSSVLAGNVTTGTGEVLPTVARTLTWRLTVRDNEAGGGGIACDEISLNVGSDGPFQITSQNSSPVWVTNSTQTVTWDVANTDDVAYTCGTVDILYSSDGGTTFGTTLVSGVTNDGSQDITAPASATSTGRIKIVCSGGSNIFFDINNVDIVIVAGCSAEGGEISNSAAVNAPEGDASLNLSLCAGVAITSVTGILDAGDPSSNLAVENLGMGTCIMFGNSPKYETLEFSLAASASVTFTRTFQGDYTSMIGLYEDSYDPNNECTSWLNSNGNYNGSTIDVSSNFSEALATGTKYVLLTSGFNTGTPPTGNYEVTFSETLYDTEPVTIAGYLYTYVIVNTGTGNIVAIDANSDLSNAGTFPAGSYAVYGLSYLSSENLAVYIGSALTTLQTDIGNTTICGDLSTNNVSVTVDALVPVELIEFNGRLNQDKVLLSWRTATEINNDYFLIEKSVDGRNFEKLGTVKGDGNSVISQEYGLVDEHPIIGVNYYRLTQVDFDGNYEVFNKIVAIEYLGVQNMVIQPNPVKGDQIQLIYQTNTEGDLKVDIYNVTGQLVQQLDLEADATRNVFDISLNNFSSGVYIIRTAHHNNIQSLRFVKTN
jgi:metallopeptidase family M12-like protein/type IX secretion system substrate protein